MSVWKGFYVSTIPRVAHNNAMSGCLVRPHNFITAAWGAGGSLYILLPSYLCAAIKLECCHQTCMLPSY